MSLIKIISGGQTGVDRAALDAALDCGLSIGGWCPKNRKALDGAIPDKYPLKETKSSDYRVRTEWNIRDSDGTLILNNGKLTGGTKLTHKLAIENSKPVFIVQLDEPYEIEDTLGWLKVHEIAILNIAGPREHNKFSIYELAQDYLTAILIKINPYIYPLQEEKVNPPPQLIDDPAEYKVN